jgi:hypothetical protein
VWFPHIARQPSAVCHSEVRVVVNSSSSIGISIQAFVTGGCNLTESSVGAEYTKVLDVAAAKS